MWIFAKRTRASISEKLRVGRKVIRFEEMRLKINHQEKRRKRTNFLSSFNVEAFEH
jgi:hypothetical protein